MFKKTFIAIILGCITLTGCSSNAGDKSDGSNGDTPQKDKTTQAPAPKTEPTLDLSATPTDTKFDQLLTFSVKDGTLVSADVKGKRFGAKSSIEESNVKLAGVLTDGKWNAKDFMEPSTIYTVSAIVSGDTGEKTITKTFKTTEVPLNRQTYASISPGKGSVVGMAQPISIRFDVPIDDKKSIEEKLKVTSIPEQAGSWHWISAQEVRYRPEKFWQPGTKINVVANINSVSAGKGKYGQFNTTSHFTTTDHSRNVVVNLDTQQLKAYRDGKLVNSFGVSTGKTYDLGFTTRTGTKVIMGHSRKYNMRSSTLNIPDGSSESYDLVVDYAMRLTNSGEFFHAAPWNSGYMGHSPQSHGCTGMNSADALWLYNFLKDGDPVKYVSAKGKGYRDRPMTIDNGFGDWNVSFDSYKKGSATN